MSSWFSSPFRQDAEAASGSEFYECMYCQADFDEWREDCPECGQLVVRIVESRGDPGR